MKINHQKKSRKTILTVTGIAVLLALLAASYLVWNSAGSKDQNFQNDINYSEATDDDKALNEELKETLPDKAESAEAETNTPATSKNTVTPVITVWGQPEGSGTDLQINGYVPGVIESEGMCTITLTKSGETASISKASIQNAQNTSCGQLIVPYTQLSAGSWQAVLSYSSSISAGSSTKTQIEVR